MLTFKDRLDRWCAHAELCGQNRQNRCNREVEEGDNRIATSLERSQTTSRKLEKLGRGEALAAANLIVGEQLVIGVAFSTRERMENSLIERIHPENENII
jgi:hypothetical protein